ncbi:MAG: ATP-binding protein, partial [Chloroflexota bacterium]
KLSALVDDMTNMKFLEVGSQEITLERVPVQQVVAHAYKESMLTIEAKGLTCEIDLPGAPVFINADQQKLEQAILNVLNNAIRFTPNSGTMDIKVSQDNDLAIIEIKDSGIGMPINELEKIFGDFYQVESHLTRTYGGMGLGLAITRGIINLHKGHIWAKSAGKDAGSSFLISLPLAT